MGKTAYLVLENGKIFQGEYFGAEGEIVSEVVFTTGMTGYLETLTDMSYYGQMVVQTFPLIGNYGVISSDFESGGIGPSAYIVKDWCQLPSNFRSEGRLDTFFKERNLIAIKGIDTRTLTKTIREKGVMNGMITSSKDDIDFEKIKAYKIRDAVKRTSTKEIYKIGSDDAPVKIALMDFGLKKNIYRELEKRGAQIIVCPCNTTAEDIINLGVDGVMLSNGPGDPAENEDIIKNLKDILNMRIPVFGICLGHQLLARANGFSTEKLKYGHRGANQPVKDLKTGQVYISSQNHGYAVVSSSIDKNIADEYFVNVNDGTNEGIEYKIYPAFSVQFHPEACSGPLDTQPLFDKFYDMIEANRKHKKTI